MPAPLFCFALYKLDYYGIQGGNLQGNLLLTLVDCSQRVLLNGCHSSWTSVASGVPQDTVLELLLLFLYINISPITISPQFVYLLTTEYYKNEHIL